MSSLAYVDSQSVRLAPRIFEHRGLDRRKRQLLTDSAGRIWAAAHQHDSGCGPALLPQRSW